MTDERRYSDEEVQAIFEVATATSADGNQVAPGSATGLTLSDLQAIAKEVGVTPEAVTRAAQSLDTRAVVAPRRTSMGLPVSAGRTVDLPRAPTDREWELIVVTLRETFGAKGKVDGSALGRSWSNGDLHIYVEPTESGYRLRMGTLTSQGLARNRLGLAGLIIGLLMLVAMLREGPMTDDIIAPLLMMAVGAGAFATNALRLPAWARTREEQMERIEARVLTLLAEPPEGEQGPT